MSGLACPVCAAGLAVQGRCLRCRSGHSFDVARQGYVNLLPGGARPGTADTVEMVRSRQAFLDAGHYRPLATALAGTAAVHHGDLVLDAGGGTGHYLRAVLAQAPGAHGLCLDLSKHAARQAAGRGQRVAAVVSDLWGRLPLQDGAAGLVLDVFAPRNIAEFHRILRPGGTLLVATAGAAHLSELVAALGLLSVDDHKDARLRERTANYFRPVKTVERTFTITLSARTARQVVDMGPNAHHQRPEVLAERIAALDWPLPVTASFRLTEFRRC